MWCAGWGSDAEEDGGQWQGHRRWRMCCGEPQSVLDSARKRREWGTGTHHGAGRNIKDVVDDGYGPEWAARSAERRWEQDRRAKVCARCGIGTKCGGAGCIGRQDGGRWWEAADWAAGTAGCGGMQSGLADPKRAGNDGETPEEARVGCDGRQEQLEGSASWGRQWGQVAGNSGLRQHGEPRRRLERGGSQEQAAAGTAGCDGMQGGLADPKAVGYEGHVPIPQGHWERGGKREVRGGKPDWRREGGERRRQKWW
ncbi:hypothetical protein B0H10DRAFT_1940327 [Mycena sp. CBHHK59/15]|nr:hypothetical protein B0H10DRAFT_1940327 [Mycena sp. CBHHK59/15]